MDEESAWPLVESWIAEAKNDARVLAGDRRRGEEALRLLQVTPRSALGAIAIETGGLLVDHGWVRVLGGDGLVRWNALGGADAVEPLEDALVVAYDAIGGFYALNGGAFPGKPGSVFFLAPDTLEWEDFEMGHSDFVRWLCDADLDGFYDELRWPGWEREVADASLELGFHLYPPPFTEQGKPVARATRRLVPMTELWSFQRECARQLADLPDGADFRFQLGP